GLDFDEEFVPSSRRTYTGILGFDKARSQVERMLDECDRMLKPYSNRNVLDEFVQMLRDTLP
ncbi:MAG: geranyl transferase, partial [Candidatus Cloacimonadaceae bacterium]